MIDPDPGARTPKAVVELACNDAMGSLVVKTVRCPGAAVRIVSWMTVRVAMPAPSGQSDQGGKGVLAPEPRRAAAHRPDRFAACLDRQFQCT